MAPAGIFLILFTLTGIIFPGYAQPVPESHSWAEVKSRGKGTIVIYWYESQPFIYRTADGMQGIEPEIMEGFRTYLHSHHDIDLQIEWREARSFADTYATIQVNKEKGILGASAFSITPERQQVVGFSPPYMSDICVLITSKGLPIVQDRAEFEALFSKLTAITIDATTYEQDILRIKQDGNLDFDIEFIPSSENILRAVEQRDSAFGFIDLPVYMMMFNDNPSINVNRQNVYPIKRKGYAFIYPTNSDWSEPLNQYFLDDEFAAHFETIISHYLDIELYHFIETLAIQSNDMVVLLTKEKEIQYKNLMGKSEQIIKETRTRNFVIILAGMISVSLIVIAALYRKRNQQKLEIERQRRSIELKNEQLEKRNQQLVHLDEEKNNLINILAHDMRTPIGHVQGLAQVLLLTNNSLPEDQKLIIQSITHASERLNKMITNILDTESIEQNGVKLFMEKVVIGALLNEILASFEKQAAMKNIRLLANHTGNGISVKGDPLFLTQVFENLISNAIKFSEKNKEVRVRVSEAGENVRVMVGDSGPGFTQEDLQLLFKKFQRLSARPTNGEQSTGLGLSIVKKYTELMGGKVWCESEEGKGATFVVEFPKG